MSSEPRVLLLEPHNDDAALFAAWTCLRHRPHVITVLYPLLQRANGISGREREDENRAAMAILGCTWQQLLSHSDEAPDWERVRSYLDHETTNGWETVFAPWPDEPGGHEQHRQIGALALETFGSERTRFYCTYAVGGDKTRGREVPYEPSWIEKKHRALACYRSQMERGPRRLFMMDLHEYEPDL